MDLHSLPRELPADFSRGRGGKYVRWKGLWRSATCHVACRIAIAGTLCLLLGLFAALVWHLSVSYVTRSVDSLCNIYSAEILARLVERWQTLISSMHFLLASYLSLLAPYSNNSSQFSQQARLSTFHTFKIVGNESIVNFEHVNGTFYSYFTSKSSGLGVVAFSNGSTSSSHSDFLYSAFNESGDPIGAVFLNSQASSFNSTVQPARLDGTVISDSTGEKWKFLSDQEPIVAVTKDGMSFEGSEKWGTASIGLRLRPIAKAMAESMTKGRMSYVVSKDGSLLASSLSEPSGIPSPFVNISQVVEVRESFNGLLKRYLTMERLLLENVHLRINIEGKSYTIFTRPLSRYGISLVVVLLLPADTCHGDLYHNNRNAVFIICMASCGLFALSVLFILFHTVACGRLKLEPNPQGMEILGPSMRVKSETFGDSKTQFMANMSHELRTPMAGIIGLMDILQCDQTLTPDQVEIVSQIRRCAMALLGILNNLLDLSKVEEGKLELKREAFDPTSELESLVEMFAVHCTTAGVDLGLDLSDDMPKEVLGDCARFRQIFANLLSNSIKFTSNGWIWIRGWVLRQGLTEPKSLEHFHQIRGDVTVYFEIEDTGLGIDPSKWESVFEHFVQGDGSSTRTHGGSGLGLSLVRAFVEAMGGEIAILPKAGSGTRIGFHVVLKQSDPAIPTPIGSRPQVPLSLNFRNQIVPVELRKTRILLSIPAGITLSIVSDWLSRKGLQASRASSWADTVLSVEEWARGKNERENVDSLNGNNRGSRTSSWGTEVLLVVIDVSFMPGMNKNPPDMAEVKGYLSRLDYFHKRGAEVACLLSPSTPIGIRNELRESLTVYIANKPLYASKLWRLLLCMVKIGEAEDISTETDWKNPLQELHQDMLVAEGTGVQLAVGFAAGASKLDLLKVDIPERQGGKGGDEGDFAKTPNKDHPHLYSEGVDAPIAQPRRWSDSDRQSGDLILFSGELNGNNSVSSVRADNQLANSCRLERMGSSKLQDSGRFSGLGGQALLASGIEIGTEIASMTSRSLPESLVEPYSTPNRSTPNAPRRTSSIPSSRGGDKMQLEAWLQEASLNQFFSEPGLKPRPDLFPQPELLKRKDIVNLTVDTSNSGNSQYIDVFSSIESPRPPYVHSASAPSLNSLQRTGSGSLITPIPVLPSSAILQDLPSFSATPQSVFSGPPSPSPPRQASSSNPFSLAPNSRLARTSSGSMETVMDISPFVNLGPLSPSHTQSSSHSISSLNSIQKLQRTRSGGADVVGEVPSFPVFGPPSPSSHSKTPYQNLPSGNANPWLTRTKSGGMEVVVDVPLLSSPPVLTPPSPSSRSQNTLNLPLSGSSRLGRTRSGGMDIVSEIPPPPLAAPPSPSFRTQNSHTLPVNGNSRLARTRSGGMDTVAESPPLPPHSVVPQHLKMEVEPLLPSSKGRVSSDVEQTDAPLHGMHILVAEDTPILRRLAVTLLEKLGARVVAVNDGQAAVEAVFATHKGDNSPPFDAVVMDCQMPRLDGYSATEAIRAAEKPLGLHLPIVALTAHAMASDEQRCLSCGMDAYLSKPANKVSLVQTLKKFVK